MQPVRGGHGEVQMASAVVSRRVQTVCVLEDANVSIISYALDAGDERLASMAEARRIIEARPSEKLDSGSSGDEPDLQIPRMLSFNGAVATSPT